jgi:hypothetical protein
VFNLAPHPHRYTVQVKRIELLKLLVREFIKYRGNLKVVLSRPCVYGVFGGPLGGFFPRGRLCVGCLRCTVQHPNIVQIHPNSARLDLGDSYFNPDSVDTVLYEATTGRVPVRGAGYGGGFGGSGWDAMWTDMSEIVRPTRDGIHGREYISTAVEIGAKPMMLQFDAEGAFTGRRPSTLRLPIPILFDQLPRAIAAPAQQVVVNAAAALQTLAVLPLASLRSLDSAATAAVPMLKPDEVDQLLELEQDFLMLELDGWDEHAYRRLKDRFPESIVAVRVPLGRDILDLVRAGAETLHLHADYHGQTEYGFAMAAIRTIHEQLVAEGLREQVSLIGSGGIIAAEHMPKAIIAGFDAVALDTALLIALQARFLGEVRDPESTLIDLPSVDPAWGSQRLINLVASWRDQLLEVLGAMGLREVRRLRGELGRAMLQAEMEAEAFGEIVGFEV